MRRRSTTTSNFGVGARESHDSSPFYDRFRPPALSDDDHVAAPTPIAEPFVCGDARHMDAIPDASVALVVTSPPYFAGKQYEEELEREGVPSSYLEYLGMLTEVFAECVKKLEPGGRVAVNVANLGRKPYRSLSADVIRTLGDELGLLLRGEIIWQKGEGANGSCAWGSFRSATNPVLRDVTERVVVASKGRFERARSAKQRAAEGLPHRSTLMTEDFTALTLDVWSIPPERARRVGHPAPFPVELPEQLIRLYTFEGDLVLDPFMGSGSALVPAAGLGRRYAGYDLEPDYVEIARARVAAATGPLSEVDGDDDSPVMGRQRLHAGKGAEALAEEAIADAGFVIVGRNRRIHRASVSVSFVAADAEGASWYFDVAGPFRAGAAGWPGWTWCGGLGRAAALRGVRGGVPLVLLTTELPPMPSDGDTALRAAGPDAFLDVVDLLSGDALERLKRYAKGRLADDPQPGFWAADDLVRERRA